MKVAPETAHPSGGRRSVDVLPRVVPGEVPGGPRRILRASALRLCVLIARTERSLGPTALNHTPPPSRRHGRASGLMRERWANRSGYWSNPLVASNSYTSHPFIPIDSVIYDVVMTFLLLWRAPQCQQGFTLSE